VRTGIKISNVRGGRRQHLAIATGVKSLNLRSLSGVLRTLTDPEPTFAGPLLDHLVGAYENGFWHGKAERLSCLDVYTHQKFDR
jgi:hypothetical protein